MSEFRGFDHLNGDEQRTKMKGWGPAPHCVVEPILYVEKFNHELHFLVCKRLKGALSVANPPACTTTNGGGHHVLVGKDDTPVDAVIRSVGTKLGYWITNKKSISPVGVFGPALNKSNMKITNDEVQLVIHNEPAEPNVPFIANVFAVNIWNANSPADLEQGSGDESLKEVGWLTLAEIVEQFGASKNHIYFQFLFQFLVNRIGGNSMTPLELAYPDWQPGTYALDLSLVATALKMQS